MTLAQNCTGVKPDSSENESNTFRINLAASSSVTPRSLSRVVANFVCLSMVLRIPMCKKFANALIGKIYFQELSS